MGAEAVILRFFDQHDREMTNWADAPPVMRLGVRHEAVARATASLARATGAGTADQELAEGSAKSDPVRLSAQFHRPPDTEGPVALPVTPGEQAASACERAQSVSRRIAAIAAHVDDDLAAAVDAHLAMALAPAYAPKADAGSLVADLDAAYDAQRGALLLIARSLDERNVGGS